MDSDKIERVWRRAIVATLALALASLVLMAVTGHDQGVHDTTFGFLLWFLCLIGAGLFVAFFALYLLYALVMLLTKR